MASHRRRRPAKAVKRSKGDTAAAISIWRLIAVGYLLVGLVLFLAYYRSVSSVIGLAGVFIALAVLRRYRVAKSQLPIWAAALSLVFACVVALLCGNMGWLYGMEQFDWNKHNIILNDLVAGDWPVVYPSGERLNYYFAIYLPAALVGKLTGSYLYAKVALSAWTVVGLFIGFANLLEYVDLGRGGAFKIALVLFLFSLYSGWDWLGYILLRGSIPPYPAHMEWATSEYNSQYSSFMAALNYTPQHLITSLLALPLILGASTTAFLFILPAAFIWSPFAAIGLSCIYAVSYAVGAARSHRMEFRVMDLAAPLLLAVPVVLPYLTHYQIDMSPSITLTPYKYVIFILTDLFVYVLAVLLLSGRMRDEKYLAAPLFIFLIALPAFKFGKTYNDVVMRVSIPLIMSVVFMILRNLFRPGSRFKSVLVVLLLLGGVLTPIHEMGRVMAGSQMKGHGVGMYQMEPPWLRQQYLGYASPEGGLISLLQRPISLWP
jgi:hypothetical protein